MKAHKLLPFEDVYEIIPEIHLDNRGYFYESFQKNKLKEIIKKDIDFVQDKTDLLNTYQVGQTVKVGINLRGREWISPQGETKHFNSIQGWRIESLHQDGSAAVPPVPPMEAFEPAKDLKTEEPDDLPF